MITTSPETDKLHAAMVAAQRIVRDPGKDRQNPHLKNRYATLESVLDEVRPAFNDSGLALIQSPGEMRDGNVHLTTRIAHESGQWIQDTASCPLGDPKGVTTAQAFGIAVAYLRRYALMSFAGVVATDDDTDGEHRHMERREEPRRQERRQESPPDDRRDEPRREEPRQERREPGPAKGGGNVFDFGKAAESFRVLDARWTNEAIAKKLGVTDFFSATAADVRTLYAKVKAERDLAAHGWSHDDIARTLGVRSVSDATVDMLQALAKKAEGGSVSPPSASKPTTRQQAQEMP